MTKATKIIYSVLALLGAFFLLQGVQIKNDVEDLQKGHGKFGATVLHSSTNIAGGHTNASTTVAGFMSNSDKLKLDGFSRVDVTAAILSALPAATYANGTLGVGATMTANANGAFPALADGTTLTAGQKFLYHGGTTENGVWDLTSAGSGGSAWVATRDPLMDQAAEIQAGVVHATLNGAQYVYKARKTVVVGTTTIFFKRVDRNMGFREGVTCFDDFTTRVLGAINTVFGPCSYQYLSVTVTAAALTANATLGVVGAYSFTAGASNVAVGGMIAGISNDGGQFVYDTNVDEELDFRFQSPVLSTGAQEFAVIVGAVNTPTTSQAKLPVDGIAFVYDRTSAVSTTNLLAVTAAGGVSTGTVLDTGIVYNAATWYRGHISHDAGDTDYRFYLNGALVGTLSSHIPTVTLGVQEVAYKNVGTTSTNFLSVDWMSFDISFPQGRAL